MIDELTREFYDFAGCYKYELMKNKIVDHFIAEQVKSVDFNSLPSFIQAIIKDRATQQMQKEFDRIKNNDIVMLQKLAENAWLDEVEKLESEAL